MFNIPTTSRDLDLSLYKPSSSPGHLGLQDVQARTHRPQEPSSHLQGLALPCDSRGNPPPLSTLLPHSAQVICPGSSIIPSLENIPLSLQRLRLNCRAKASIRQTPYLTVQTNKEQTMSILLSQQHTLS